MQAHKHEGSLSYFIIQKKKCDRESRIGELNATQW